MRLGPHCQLLQRHFWLSCYATFHGRAGEVPSHAHTTLGIIPASPGRELMRAFPCPTSTGHLLVPRQGRVKAAVLAAQREPWLGQHLCPAPQWTFVLPLCPFPQGRVVQAHLPLGWGSSRHWQWFSFLSAAPGH